VSLPVDAKATFRVCTGCGVNKAVSDFHDSSRRSGVRIGGQFKQSRCKTCQNRDKAPYRERNRKFLADQKLQRGCEDCGFNASAVALDFHHVGAKSFSLASGRALMASIGALQREISNCVVLCANCHRRRHHERGESHVAA
jgi:hypothetical protein